MTGRAETEDSQWVLHAGTVPTAAVLDDMQIAGVDRQVTSTVEAGGDHLPGMT